MSRLPFSAVLAASHLAQGVRGVVESLIMTNAVVSRLRTGLDERPPLSPTSERAWTLLNASVHSLRGSAAEVYGLMLPPREGATLEADAPDQVVGRLVRLETATHSLRAQADQLRLDVAAASEDLTRQRWARPLLRDLATHATAYVTASDVAIERLAAFTAMIQQTSAVREATRATTPRRA